MRNISGYYDQSACSQDCLYCCSDVAWQSSCHTNECFCLASSFSDRLRYVEYRVSIQCQGNVDDVLSATSIVKNYCSNSLWTSVYLVVTNADATQPTAAPEVTVPAGFIFESPVTIVSASATSQSSEFTSSKIATTSSSATLAITPSNSIISTQSMPSITPTTQSSSNEMSGFSRSDVTAIGVGLGVGIPAILVAVLAWWLPRQRH
jgi:hypothetical protein